MLSPYHLPNLIDVLGKFAPHQTMKLVSIAIEEQNLSILNLFYDLKYTFTQYHFSQAVELGNHEIVKWLISKGCSLGLEKDNWKFFGSHLEQFKYAEKNCDGTRTIEILNTVVGCGDLETLKYARKKGFKWKTFTMKILASRGDLECIKYAHENGCPWNKWTCYYAAEGGHLEVLKYLRENDCPWDFMLYVIAKHLNHHHVMEYCDENGCPKF